MMVESTSMEGAMANFFGILLDGQAAAERMGQQIMQGNL